jgi:PAS domain S-box-containing protein
MMFHMGKKARDLASHLDEKIIHYQNIIEQSPFAIELLNPDGSIFFINNAWMHLWGIDEEEAAQTLQHYNMLTDKEAEARGAMPLIRKAFAGERVVLPIIEYNAQNVAENIGLDQLDANTAWIQCHLSPVFNEDGKIQFVVNAYVDLTERTKAKKERNRVLKLSPDLICIFDIDGCLRYTNPAWKPVMGYSEQELLGRSIRDFIHPDDQERVRQKKEELLEEELLEGEASFEFDIRCIAKDGAVRHVAWRCISDAAEKLSYCIGRDVTERRKMDLEIREQRDVMARMERTSSMGQLPAHCAASCRNRVGLLVFGAHFFRQFPHGLHGRALQIAFAGAKPNHVRL